MQKRIFLTFLNGFIVEKMPKAEVLVSAFLFPKQLSRGKMGQSVPITFTMAEPALKSIFTVTKLSFNFAIMEMYLMDNFITERGLKGGDFKMRRSGKSLRQWC